MIVGVDHVNLSCSDLSGAELLARDGFTIEFAEGALPNSERKRPLLHSYTATHGLAYCSANDGVAIELTGHGRPVESGPSRFQVLLSAPPSEASATTTDLPWGETFARALNTATPALVAWPAFDTEIWHEGAAGHPTVRALLLPVTDLERARRFWEGALGASVDRAGTGWLRTAIRSALPKWSLRVVLAEGAAGRASLDDAGFPCVGLLSTSIERDLDALLDHGAGDSTGIFDLVVNEHPLRVAMATGPDGELIELIQVAASPG